MDHPGKVGNPARVSLSVGEDEHGDAGQDGRTHLVRPNSQARMWTRKCSCFPVQLTTSNIGNNNRLIHFLLKVLTIRTYQVHVICTYCTSIPQIYLLYCTTSTSTPVLLLLLEEALDPDVRPDLCSSVASFG